MPVGYFPLGMFAAHNNFIKAFAIFIVFTVALLEYNRVIICRY